MAALDKALGMETTINNNNSSSNNSNNNNNNNNAVAPLLTASRVGHVVRLMLAHSTNNSGSSNHRTDSSSNDSSSNGSKGVDRNGGNGGNGNGGDRNDSGNTNTNSIININGGFGTMPSVCVLYDIDALTQVTPLYSSNPYILTLALELMLPYILSHIYNYPMYSPVYTNP